jgi:hypothetical protein
VASATPADTVLVNAHIWRGKGLSDAQAIAIRDGRILDVGTTEEMQRLVGPKTRVIDVQNKRVVPGFIDSHLHMLGGGLRLAQVALKDAKDEEEFGKRLREFDTKLPRDRWMLGGNWDHDRAFAGTLPDAALLDKYVPNRPVFLRRYDGHMALANTAALKLAGLTEKTADPAGGVIYRKPGTMTPTGLLRDNAMSLVDRLIPEPAEDEIAEGLRAALAETRSVGLTGAIDMDGNGSGTRRRVFRLYQQMHRAGTLTMRVDLRWPLAQWKELADMGVEAGFGNDYVRIGGLKGFVDGSLGSSTAKMFEPYVNEPGSTGVFVTPPGKLREYIFAADKAGLNVAVHAIGDRANSELLDIYGELVKKHGPRDRRYRIEHAQHLRPSDYKRFKQFGVIPSMQPFHIIDDGRWAEGRIGPKRCESSYANRALLDAGAKLAFGSDWSVAPLSPLLGIDAAVHRRTLDGKHQNGWFAEQKITVAEALEAYTMGSAHAAGREKDLGTIEIGKLADMVVLSRDILAEKERDRIAETSVVMTFVGGKVVFEKK